MDVDTIVFLTSASRVLKKDYIVEINEDKIRIGPKGVCAVQKHTTPDYVVRFEEPLQRQWLSILDAMRDGRFKVYKFGEDVCMSDKLVHILAPVVNLLC